MNRRGFIAGILGTAAAAAGGTAAKPSKPNLTGVHTWHQEDTITAADLNRELDIIYGARHKQLAGVIQVDGPLDERFRELVRQAMEVQ